MKLLYLAFAIVVFSGSAMTSDNYDTILIQSELESDSESSIYLQRASLA